MKNLEGIFSGIVSESLWGQVESLSGPGSTIAACRPILSALPEWISRYQLRSIADLGCGDFHWMAKARLEGISYDGYDVVRELIQWNNLMHARENVRFHHADFLEDPFVPADLVICKDVLIHFPTELVVRGLGMILWSGAEFLAATTHEGAERTSEPEVGGFSPIDLERLGLNEPLEKIAVPHAAGTPPKFLALWKL